MHKFRLFILAFSVVCFDLMHNAQAQSLDTLMGNSGGSFSDTVTVACGILTKSNCDQVLPLIAEHSVPLGVSLNPIQSRGSVQSAMGVCLGVVQAAIGQDDAFNSVGSQTKCEATYDIIGQPLYPYLGYMVVSYSNPAKSLSDLVSNVPTGKTLNISAGPVGSGGQVTFNNILATSTDDHRVINMSYDDWTLAQSELTEGRLDGYFVMDGPGSSLIEQIKNDTDSKGNPLYKFVTVDPDPSFYNLTDQAGKLMYQPEPISGGFLFWGHINTVSTNAVFIVNKKWETGGTSDSNSEQAVAYLVQAMNQASAAIIAKTLTPSDWNGAINAQ